MIGAVVLAAGLSRRMGTGKMLLKLGDDTVIGHVLHHIKDSSLDDVVVVYGPHMQEVKKEADRYGMKSAENPHADEGLSTSVRLGLSRMLHCSHVMFILGDQPFIMPEDIDRLCTQARVSQDAIIVPTDSEGHGNPIIFPRRLFGEISEASGDVGARMILRKHWEDAVFVPVTCSDIRFDIDSPADYKAAQDKSHLLKTD